MKTVLIISHTIRIEDVVAPAFSPFTYPLVQTGSGIQMESANELVLVHDSNWETHHQAIMQVLNQNRKTLESHHARAPLFHFQTQLTKNDFIGRFPGLWLNQELIGVLVACKSSVSFTVVDRPERLASPTNSPE